MHFTHRLTTKFYYSKLKQFIQFAGIHDIVNSVKKTFACETDVEDDNDTMWTTKAVETLEASSIKGEREDERKGALAGERRPARGRAREREAAAEGVRGRGKAGAHPLRKLPTFSSESAERKLVSIKSAAERIANYPTGRPV
ncbi:hypothetical protein GWI33_019425 [Rhynchophorus ferrugineus]|uniref:Uncharacterized protein n=1 Tax=Rhynchophorus ferrugineus TaxID=354439 RepID=A0A834HUR2_RHYFE|nr:hypothetical protein GWI33_019425 [Rhynchophorus ferrugineus]